MVKYGAPAMASSGYVAEVDGTLSIACAVCKDACPFEAMQADGIAVVNWEAFMGCGICARKCPNEAMSLVRHERERCATGRAAISSRTRCAPSFSVILYFNSKSLPLPPYKEWKVVGESVKLALWSAGFGKNEKSFLYSSTSHFSQAYLI